MCCAMLSHSVVPDSLRLYGLKPARLLCPWGFSRQEIPMHRPPGFIHGDSVHEDHALLQGTFPMQGSNPGLLHGRGILYQLSHQGSPRILEWVAYPFSRGSSQPWNQTSVSCIAEGFFHWANREALISYIPTQNKKFKVWKEKKNFGLKNLQKTRLHYS